MTTEQVREKARELQVNLVAWPVWTPIPNRPWLIGVRFDAETCAYGDCYRKPPEGRKHEAYRFKTADQAFAFIVKNFKRISRETGETF
jgi:hypothetical protein